MIFIPAAVFTTIIDDKGVTRGTQELHSNSTTFGVKENMYWIPINELDNYKAFPTFMKDYLCREYRISKNCKITW